MKCQQNIEQAHGACSMGPGSVRPGVPVFGVKPYCLIERCGACDCKFALGSACGGPGLFVLEALAGVFGLGSAWRFLWPLRRSDAQVLSRNCPESPFSAGSAVSRGSVPWWRIMRSGRRGRRLSIGEVALTGDGFQRNLGNGFARVWRVAGSPYRGPTFSACCVSQRRVPDHVPAVPLQ